MDKSFILFLLVGVGAIYFVTNFIGDIQKEDETFRSSSYDQKNQYNQYKKKDSIGREILDVTGAPVSVQMDAWHASPLKTEFLEIFPDFSGMQLFAEERVRGNALKTKLKSTIENVETAYFSGAMNSEDAKRKLGTL